MTFAGSDGHQPRRRNNVRVVGIRSAGVDCGCPPSRATRAIAKSSNAVFAPNRPEGLQRPIYRRSGPPMVCVPAVRRSFTDENFFPLFRFIAGADASGEGVIDCRVATTTMTASP